MKNVRFNLEGALFDLETVQFGEKMTYFVSQSVSFPPSVFFIPKMRLQTVNWCFVLQGFASRAPTLSAEQTRIYDHENS